MSTFDDRARDWDTPERRARAEAVAAAIRVRVPLGPDVRAIEIGAGTGLLGLELAGELGELVLAEPSSGMLEVAREKLASRTFGHVSAIRLDLVADPPPPGDPFDLALSLLVLHHIPDPAMAFRATRELLRPGGHLALVDLDTEDGSFHRSSTEDIYANGYDRGELVRLAEAAGFVNVEVTTATELEREGRRYPLFLLVAERA